MTLHIAPLKTTIQCCVVHLYAYACICAFFYPCFLEVKWLDWLFIIIYLLHYWSSNPRPCACRGYILLLSYILWPQRLCLSVCCFDLFVALTKPHFLTQSCFKLLVLLLPPEWEDYKYVSSYLTPMMRNYKYSVFIAEKKRKLSFRKQNLYHNKSWWEENVTRAGNKDNIFILHTWENKESSQRDESDNFKECYYKKCFHRILRPGVKLTVLKSLQ